jgi:predicted metalloprotease with PDZ domain
VISLSLAAIVLFVAPPTRADGDADRRWLESAPQASSVATARYVVTVTDTGSRTALVDAMVPMRDSLLKVRQGAADHLPLGWITFVHLETVEDPLGRGLAATADSANGWRIAPKVAWLRLRYRVDLSYGRSAWPPGNEQAGWWDGRSFYSVTKPLFVTGGAAGPSEVRFDLPAGWTVLTPWVGAPDGRGYVASDEEDLTNNSLVWGRVSGEHVTAGMFEFTIAMLGATRLAGPLLEKTILPVAREYGGIFPETPRSRYLMTVFDGSEDDGESFDRSSAFRTRHPLTPGNAVTWAGTMAHELFHYWNGGLLAPRDEITEAWFTEGFTEYYANRTLLRVGALSPSAFLEKASAMLGLYTYFRTQPMFDTVSVLRAGERRTRYRFGVYNGGWAIAFSLDRELERATAGREGLDTLMRRLLHEHRAERSPFRVEDVIDAASAVAGRDMHGWFARYVAGFDLLPLEGDLAELGVRSEFIPYAGECYLRLDDHPNASQRAEWRKFATPNRR